MTNENNAAEIELMQIAYRDATSEVIKKHVQMLEAKWGLIPTNKAPLPDTLEVASRLGFDQLLDGVPEKPDTRLFTRPRRRWIRRLSESMPSNIARSRSKSPATRSTRRPRWHPRFASESIGYTTRSNAASLFPYVRGIASGSDRLSNALLG